ncbi:DUF2649 family protein [Spiroplasma endosymbiont of Polydrusus formosus]|uniref:DUF2649 family protein n=1 Tax=Spiroplasma endosymbiont of Polydrusus formosus TaxID=3139326 RepID=UPI0035B569B5
MHIFLFIDKTNIENITTWNLTQNEYLTMIVGVLIVILFLTWFLLWILFKIPTILSNEKVCIFSNIFLLY